MLLPPSLDDWLPAEHLARFIAELVDEHVDCRGGAFVAGDRGQVHRRCGLSVAGRGAAPDYRAIARFRKRHLSALGHLFVQALALCQAAGMVRLGRVALDGTKVRANASKHKAMSYARMSEKERVLAEQV